MSMPASSGAIYYCTKATSWRDPSKATGILHEEPYCR